MDMSSLKEQTRRGGKSLMTYPHPSFDLSSAFIPPSMKELYRWCLYLYVTHPEVKSIIRKKVAYVQTPFVYEGEEYAKKVWQRILEEYINVKRVEMEAMLDANIYGVAYLSMYYPFERFLTCPSCKASTLLKNMKWEYSKYEWSGECPTCKRAGKFESKTVSVRTFSRAGVIRWRPMDMEVDANPWTGRKHYVYRPPKMIIKKLENPKRNKHLVEETPDEILEAIRENKNFELDPAQIFVFSEVSPSSEDDSFPMPPLLHVFKDSWLYQTLRRAQEAISAEHILPLTLLVPAPAPGGVSPHTNYNLASWASEMQGAVWTWRRDPNVIYTAPFPASIENIRGDAQALNTFRDQEIVRQAIASGLGVPIEFVTGGLSWSGGSISLRMLENEFLNDIEGLSRFEKTFLIPRLQSFYRLPKITIRHQKFKMADDPQQKQIALSLRQTNTISDETTRSELNFDNEVEIDRLAAEREKRAQQIYQDQIAQAKTQAETQLIMGESQITLNAKMAQEQARVQAEAQAQQQEQMAAQGQAVDQGQSPMPAATTPPSEPQPITTQKVLPGPDLLNLMVDSFMKSTSDDLKEEKLLMLQKTNPTLVRAIKRRMQLIQNAAKSLRALPEQKPPRSPKSGIQ